MAGSVTGGAAGYQAYAKREQHLGIPREKGGNSPAIDGDFTKKNETWMIFDDFF